MPPDSPMPPDPWEGVVIGLSGGAGSQLGVDLAEQAFQYIARLNQAGVLCDLHTDEAFQAIAVWALAAYVWVTDDDEEPGDLLWDTLTLTAKVQLDRFKAKRGGATSSG